jgi:hypothetical protein
MSPTNKTVAMQVNRLVRKHALQHIKPLHGAKLLECHAANRLIISVTFSHDGCTQTQLVGIGVPLPEWKLRAKGESLSKKGSEAR